MLNVRLGETAFMRSISSGRREIPDSGAHGTPRISTRRATRIDPTAARLPACRCSASSAAGESRRGSVLAARAGCECSCAPVPVRPAKVCMVPETRATVHSFRRMRYKSLMPTYIMLSTLSPEGVQTIKNNPSRIREVNREVEQLGATVKAQWATLGQFDFVNVVEAPDEKTMARISLELGSRGTAKYETLSAIPIDDFIDSI